MPPRAPRTAPARRPLRPRSPHPLLPSAELLGEEPAHVTRGDRGGGVLRARGRSGSALAVQAPWEDYDAQPAAEIVKRVRTGDEATKAVVLLYERGHKARESIIRAAGGVGPTCVGTQPAGLPADEDGDVRPSSAPPLPRRRPARGVAARHEHVIELESSEGAGSARSSVDFLKFSPPGWSCTTAACSQPLTMPLGAIAVASTETARPSRWPAKAASRS